MEKSFHRPFRAPFLLILSGGSQKALAPGYCPSPLQGAAWSTSKSRFKHLVARLICTALVVFPIIILSIACGKHKAQVKTPLPPKPAAAPAETGTIQEPVAPPLSPAEDNATQKVGPQPAIPTIEQARSESDFSPGPLIRIGLAVDAKEIRISSKADYYLTEKKPEASRQLVHGEIQARVEQEADENSVYRVQVAAFTKMGMALDLKKKLSKKYDRPVLIHENGESEFKYVWIGEFPSREEARSFLKTLVRSGYADAFIVKESVATESGGSTLVLHGPKSLFRLSGVGFLFQPSSRTNFISIDGKPYHGLVDISLNKNGRITVVNQLGMEEYLLGVVPAEMNPSSYPEFEALAAQSIAARTYALNNMGRFSSDGFDLSNDTRTQVYEGVAVERDITNEAVHKTSGLAIYYQDKLIDAMYMSTCGGRTEDYANVFDSSPVPYLVSVFCAVESGPEKGEAVLQGKHDLDQIIWADDASVANRNLEFARALGIVERSEMSPESLGGPAERAEVIRWVESATKIAQKTQTGARAAAPDLHTRAGFIQYAAEAFFGGAEIKRKISPRDVEYYIGNLKDGSAVPDSARPALCYLIQNGLWRPYPDNTVRPDEPMRREDTLSLLLHWVEFARPEILRKGTFVSAGSVKDEPGAGFSINVKWGSRTQEFRFSQNPCLFRLDPGRTTPVSSLRIIGNEKLHFHVDAQGNIDFLEIELNPTGASSDRYSPQATWNTTLSRSALAEKLRGLAANIGEIKDLKPYKTGNSGRVVQIQVIGNRSSVVLNGYKVRNALGLRDIPYSFTRENNPDGSVASFTFHGRGWGHGVGLCQVGAFGMARAGRSYEEILKTYYQGVQIRKAY